MGKIQVLDEHIANQIAAGEVVERPSSVVKELVENAIDAGSTRVDVYIEEGGLQLIRVADNGSGIAAEDCETAFYRHATSKIRAGRDLFRISSLGFRGEALASIAAVSRTECLTSTDDSGLGRRLVIEGGSLIEHQEAAAKQGTDIRIRDLFYNTPARLKYMKTIQTELGHISDYMYRLAMAHPDISLTLKHNDKELLRTLGNGDLLQVIAAVYGTATAKSMVHVQGESLDYRMQGLVGRPELTRSNRNGISFVINGRYIRNYALAGALLQAYHTLLPIHRFPMAVIHVQMDPELVDVNVHPSKLEVRFSKETELVQLIQQTVRKALLGEVLIPQAGLPKSPSKPAVVQEQLRLYEIEDLPAAKSSVSGAASADNEPTERGLPSTTSIRPAFETKESAKVGKRDHAKDIASDYANDIAQDGSEDTINLKNAEGGSFIRSNKRAAGPISTTSSQKQQRHASPPKKHEVQQWMGLLSNDEESTAASPELRSAPQESRLPKLHPIGQMHGLYIIAQNEDGLYLVDQHAAHERINYEYYYSKFGQPEQASQELLLPITLEFTPDQAELLKERLVLFQQAGVYMEPFGGNTFKVTSYPYWLPKGQEQEVIMEMAEWVLLERKAPDVAKLREQSAIVCACKASIKANQQLSLPQIERLLERLREARNPFTCPHGRPVVVSFSTYDLEKMFKRVM